MTGEGHVTILGWGMQAGSRIGDLGYRLKMEITEVKIYPFDTTSYGSRTKAFAEITIDGLLTIRGLRIIESKSGGLFVSYPSQVGREGKPRSLIIFGENKLREKIRRAVIDAYREGEQDA